MRVYLAARYSRRREMLDYRQDLEALGFKVTSRWIDGHHGESFEDITPTFRKKCAEEDRADLLSADICIVFLPGGRHGGLFWEMGAADVKGLKIFLCGPQDSGPVFGYLNHIEAHDNWYQTITAVRIFKEHHDYFVNCIWKGSFSTFKP